MAECKHECIVLKRICIFILGVVIGFAGGYKYALTKVQHRFHDRMMKKAEESVHPRYRKTPEKRDQPFFEKREKRQQKLREQKERTETPKERVPR
tara:strand:- start:2143 stop:2427 length:285 start_codon:yes stop_codon:yes gene_type:complete